MTLQPTVPAMPVVPVDESVAAVIEESIDVQRRAVETGVVVEVSKFTDEETVQVHETLASDFVDAERVEVGRVVSEMPVVRHEGTVMIVPIVEERLVVRKELFLVAQLHVTRRRELRQITEAVQLQHQRVRVRRFDPATGQWQESGEDPTPGSTPGPDPPLTTDE